MAFFMVTSKDKNSSRQLLKILQVELKLTFELEKQSTCSIKLANVSDLNHVAFKVSSASLEKYRVHPNIGLVNPNSTCDFTVTIQTTDQVDIKFKDKLLIQSKIVPLWTNQHDVTPAMFGEDSVSYIEENILWVVPVNRAHSPTLNLTTDMELLKKIFKNLKAESAISSGKEECSAIKVDVNPGVLVDREAVSRYQSTRSTVWNWLFPSIIITVIGFGLLILFEYVLYPLPRH